MQEAMVQALVSDRTNSQRSTWDVMSIENTYLDRILDPVAECLTPQVASHLAELRADRQTHLSLELFETVSLGLC